MKTNLKMSVKATGYKSDKDGNPIEIKDKQNMQNNNHIKEVKK